MWNGTPCWLWMGTIDHTTGYGRFWYDNKNGMPHRASYEIYKGEIPDGLTIDHLCSNRICVNPDHLDPCPSGENTLRSPNTLTKINSLKTHCPKGHPYSGENLVEYGGRRYCRICRKKSMGAANKRMNKKRVEIRRALMNRVIKINKNVVDKS